MRIKNHEMNLLIKLEEVMMECNQCYGKNRKDVEYIALDWTPLSKFVVIADSKDEIEISFWEEVYNNGFRRDQFAVIYMTNCSNVFPWKENCTPFIRKFVKIIDPEMVILMGERTLNYFMYDYKKLRNGGYKTRLIRGDISQNFVFIINNRKGEYSPIITTMNILLRRNNV